MIIIKVGVNQEKKKCRQASKSLLPPVWWIVLGLWETGDIGVVST